MYKLNNEPVTKKRVDELIDDLAMFPYDKTDCDLSIKSRKKKYITELEANKKLQIADDLCIEAEK